MGHQTLRFARLTLITGFVALIAPVTHINRSIRLNRTIRLVIWVCSLIAVNACGSSSTTSSGSNSLIDGSLVNGFYIDRITRTVEDLISPEDSDLNFIGTSEFTLNNGTNTIEESIFKNGLPDGGREILNFSPTGVRLSRLRYSSDNELSLTVTYSYSDNGLLTSMNYNWSGEFASVSERVYEYDAGSLVRIQYFDSNRTLEATRTFSYNDAGQISASRLAYLFEDGSIEPYDDCQMIYSNGLKTNITCYRYSRIENEKRLYSVEDLEYDVHGNRIRSIENYYELDGQNIDFSDERPVGALTSIVTRIYEYKQTDRFVPNSSLFTNKYFPDS